MQQWFCEKDKYALIRVKKHTKELLLSLKKAVKELTFKKIRL